MIRARLGQWEVQCGREAEYREQVALAGQRHGGKIVPAGVVKNGWPVADGIVLTLSELAVAGVYTADCMPLVLAGSGRAVVLHVSRKSLVAGLLEEAIGMLGAAGLEYAYIGPHICGRHFTFQEMGAELQRLYHMFPAAFSREDGKWLLSLEAAVMGYLGACGFTGNVTRDGRCTYEDPELPSYRRGEIGRAEDRSRLITAVGPAV